MSNQLSAVEAELYDRQIRLWGLESQEKLRAANVLLIGVRGLGSEIAKNILLAGINSLTILDNGVATREEQLKNFLLPPDCIGKHIAREVLVKAKALNPLVKIVVDTDAPESKELSFFENFTIVVATGLKTDLLLKINKTCRAKKVQLISGDVFGTFGCAVLDLGQHNYFEDQVKFVGGKKRGHDGSEKETVRVEEFINYPELKKVIVLPNSKQKIEHLKKYKRYAGLFFVMLAMAEFRNKFNRNPCIETRRDDYKALVEIKQQILDLYEIDSAKLDDEIFNMIYGEVGPACAVVGGVIAQEVIKAVSHRSVPINNVFLFDPFAYNGTAECIPPAVL